MPRFDDLVGVDDFVFDAPQTFTRQRATQIADPYNPDATVKDWSNPAEISVDGFLSSTSSLEQGSEVRAEVVSDAQLVITDPAADVKRGDRIVQGDRMWVVAGFPANDLNPFTGWNPTLVVSLEEVVG